MRVCIQDSVFRRFFVALSVDTVGHNVIIVPRKGGIGNRYFVWSGSWRDDEGELVPLFRETFATHADIDEQLQ